MNREERAVRVSIQCAFLDVRDFLASPGRYMSPAETEWWRRLLGNLEKAQHDNPHLSSRKGEGAHNG